MAVTVYVEPLRVAVSVPLAVIVPPPVMGIEYWKVKVVGAEPGLIPNPNRATNIAVTQQYLQITALPI
jgi:hypothetical protein